MKAWMNLIESGKLEDASEDIQVHMLSIQLFYFFLMNTTSSLHIFTDEYL